jgi:hypothetical protein
MGNFLRHELSNVIPLTPLYVDSTVTTLSFGFIDGSGEVKVFIFFVDSDSDGFNGNGIDIYEAATQTE